LPPPRKVIREPAKVPGYLRKVAVSQDIFKDFLTSRLNFHAKRWLTAYNSGPFYQAGLFSCLFIF